MCHVARYLFLKALATASRSYGASPMLLGLMNANFDVRHVLPNVDIASSLRCSWRLRRASRHMRIECAHTRSPPKAIVHTESLRSVSHHSGDRVDRFVRLRPRQTNWELSGGVGIDGDQFNSWLLLSPLRSSLPSSLVPLTFVYFLRVCHHCRDCRCSCRSLRLEHAGGVNGSFVCTSMCLCVMARLDPVFSFGRCEPHSKLSMGGVGFIVLISSCCEHHRSRRPFDNFFEDKHCGFWPSRSLW